jgi:bacillithiol system protein YtxJ
MVKVIVLFWFLILMPTIMFAQSDKLSWQYIQGAEEIINIKNGLTEQTVLFFKHSHRCGLSELILDDLEKDWRRSPQEVRLIFVDVWQQRAIANLIAEEFGIKHHSPQAILVRKGKVIYQQSHGRIKVVDIEKALGN